MSTVHPHPAPAEPDEDEHAFDYGKGGVPGFLVFVYVAFLTFCLWYIVSFFAPSFLKDHPAEGSPPLEQHAEP